MNRTREEYENCVFIIADLIVSLVPDTKIIERRKFFQVWNTFNNRPDRDVPGYWMTDAMEKWGKRNGYELMFNVNKHGKRKNVMLVKA